MVQQMFTFVEFPDVLRSTMDGESLHYSGAWGSAHPLDLLEAGTLGFQAAGCALEPGDVYWHTSWCISWLLVFHLFRYCFNEQQFGGVSYQRAVEYSECPGIREKG